MSDRPEDFRFDAGLATVKRVYQDSWECDLEAEDGGVINRALVEGPRLPEVSTPDRPQWVVYAHSSHLQGRAVCRPVESRLTGPRLQRLPFMRYEEVQRFRTTIAASIDQPKTPAELEIRNQSGDVLLQVRIQEQDGVIRIDTPKTRIVLKNSDGSIEVHCDGNLTATVDGDATATVKGNLLADVTGTVEIDSQASITLKAPNITIDGLLEVTKESTFDAPISVTGGVTATGPVVGTNIDALGNVTGQAAIDND